MILHLIFNTLIVFIWLTLIIQFFLFFLKIKNSRTRYICRSLPFLKIPFDFFVFAFFGDALFINLNPFSCEIFVYEMISKIFPSQTSEGLFSEHIIIPQYIAMQIPSMWLHCLNVMVILIALGGIGYKLFQLFQSQTQIEKIKKNGTPFEKLITNKKLQDHLNSLQAKILLSEEIEIPFATGSYIILPKKIITELSYEELLAVIAHELQHLRWKDPLFKFIFSLICSLCWWIPAKKWLDQLVDEQEQASDAGIQTYGIDNLALATGIKNILKTAKDSRLNNTAICLLSSSKNLHLNRIKQILDRNDFLFKNKYQLKCLYSALLCLFAFMSLWVC